MTCKSSTQDHNGNKGNHFLFLVSSWVVISKPWDFANFKILYMYFKCVFNILLYCFMLLICDTKINDDDVDNKKVYCIAQYCNRVFLRIQFEQLETEIHIGDISKFDLSHKK